MSLKKKKKGLQGGPWFASDFEELQSDKSNQCRMSVKNENKKENVKKKIRPVFVIFPISRKYAN